MTSLCIGRFLSFTGRQLISFVRPFSSSLSTPVALACAAKDGSYNEEREAKRQGEGREQGEKGHEKIY